MTLSFFFPQNDIQPEFQVCVLRSDLTSQPWAENLSLSWPEPTEDAGEHMYFIDLRLAASLLTSLPYQAEAFLGMGYLILLLLLLLLLFLSFC